MTYASSRRRRLAAGLIAAGLLLTACSTDPGLGTGTGGAAGTESGATAPTQADVTFAQELLAHDQQLLATTALAGERAEDPRVKELSTRLEAATQPDVEKLTGWLSTWGSGAGSAAAGSAPVAELADASGAAFDRLFVEQVIEQHSAAITLADAEVAGGHHPEAVDMAKRISADYGDAVIQLAQLRIDLGP
jgi:uncharacterized protein (DUF305 family)